MSTSTVLEETPEETPDETESNKGPLHVPLDEPYAYMEKLKNRQGELFTKLIRGPTIKEFRKMKLIDIEIEKKFMKAYVDCITGSLYNPTTGRCFSSSALRIVTPRSKSK